MVTVHWAKLYFQVSSTGVSTTSLTPDYSRSISFLKDSVESRYISPAEALQVLNRTQEVLAGLLIGFVHWSPIYMALYCTAVCHRLVCSLRSTVNPRNCSPTLPNYLVLICTPEIDYSYPRAVFCTCLEKNSSSFSLLYVPPISQLQILPLVYLWEGGKTFSIGPH